MTATDAKRQAGRNRSAAVVPSRKAEYDSAGPPDQLDYWPTPPWCTRALLEWMASEIGANPARLTCLEPACGEGHMARPLAEAFGKVCAADIWDYTATFPGQGVVCDFLGDPDPALFFGGPRPDWIVSNPPFSPGERFVLAALDLARAGVAMFVRSGFTETLGRYERLYSQRKPAQILQFVERCSLVPGRLDPDSNQPHIYCWMIWLRDGAARPFAAPRTEFDWIAPCRKRLERPGDYLNPGEGNGPLFDPPGDGGGA